MTDFSDHRTTELRDALDEEIQRALESGVKIQEVFGALGFLLQKSIQCMGSAEERDYAVKAARKLLLRELEH